MLELFFDMGMFVFKAFIIVVAIVVVVGFIVSIRASKKSMVEGSIELTNVSDQLEQQHEALLAGLLDKQEYKLWKKQRKQEEKKKQPSAKVSQKDAAKKKKTAIDANNDFENPKVFIIDFEGDIKASQAHNLSREITAIVQLATSKDEVVLRLESAGGMVHGYGLASSQLQRLQEHSIPLTICVDKVAASGGYMMAAMATKIIAAPFAIVGSIGVIAQIPNFNKLLKNWQIDYEQHTSGKYKRTLTMLGANTAEGRKKFRQELDTTHGLFKDMVHKQRPKMNIAQVATGETWYGQQAVELKLIDEVMTSDEYLYKLSGSRPVYHIAYKVKKTLSEKIGIGASAVVENTCLRWLQKNLEQETTSGR